MESRVLMENRVTPDAICRDCQNAIWRVARSLPEKCAAIHTKERKQYACWCVISHEYVPASFEDCDAYLPSLEEQA